MSEFEIKREIEEDEMRRLCGVALCIAEVISAAKQRHSHEILHWCGIIEASSIHL